MTIRQAVTNLGVQYTTDNEHDLAVILAKGVVRSNKQNLQYSATPTNNEKLLSGIEDFGNIINAAGGIMSSITKNEAEQRIITYNIQNNTPYTLVISSIGGSDFNDVYILEMPDHLGPFSSGLLKFELNSKSSLSDNPFKITCFMSHPETGNAVMFGLNFDDIDGEGLNSVSFGTSPDFGLTHFNDYHGANISGMWFVGDTGQVSFGVTSFTQTANVDNFTIDFTNYSN
ncbi:hypothetical protein [Klebsiella aerogenes]|uniref:hypothetical protein n=1 Tax=Klebsiella aerogenes TaxID=548 RepID=UPI0021CFE1B4|nr:hypothetical protein [Klebsiella aerogenes]MCU6317973.1 hypothetical protein [Klebsiella aerogenes]